MRLIAACCLLLLYLAAPVVAQTVVAPDPVTVTVTATVPTPQLQTALPAFGPFTIVQGSAACARCEPARRLGRGVYKLIIRHRNRGG